MDFAGEERQTAQTDDCEKARGLWDASSNKCLERKYHADWFWGGRFGAVMWLHRAFVANYPNPHLPVHVSVSNFQHTRPPSSGSLYLVQLPLPLMHVH